MHINKVFNLLKRPSTAAVAGLIVLVIVVGWFLYIREESSIPSEIKQKVYNTLIAPDDKIVEVDKESYKFNDDQKLLTYTAEFEGSSLNITQQPTPESFIDIPQVYEKVVAQMGEYSKFESRIGLVYLTKAKGQNNQIAVTNTKGTLMFVKSSKDMSREVWMRFFNTFEVIP